jgi:hypothetical protein
MYLSRFISKNTFFPIIVFTIFSSLIADTLIAKIYTFTTNQAFSSWRFASFVIISAIFVVGQYLVLEFVKKRIKEISSKSKFSVQRIHTIVTITQYIIAIIVAFITLQVIVSSQYYNFEIMTCVTISYGLAIILLGLLSFRFFSWFRVYGNIGILLYGISSIMILANVCLTIAFADILLTQQPSISRPHTGFAYPPQFLVTLSSTSIINHSFIISSIGAYATFWLATSILLRYYSEKLGRVKYWTLLSIPLVYFALQFLPSFANSLLSVMELSPISIGIIYTIIFTLSKPIGGILFGIAFWFVARSIPRNTIVRRYFIMASFGIILLFASNQAIVLVTNTYPAFGLVTASTVGLSSYLLFLGIYASALSVAQNEKLRHSIRKVALDESKLLGSIGSAQQERELQSLVMRMTISEIKRKG